MKATRLAMEETRLGERMATEIIAEEERAGASKSLPEEKAGGEKHKHEREGYEAMTTEMQEMVTAEYMHGCRPAGKPRRRSKI